MLPRASRRSSRKGVAPGHDSASRDPPANLYTLDDIFVDECPTRAIRPNADRFGKDSHIVVVHLGDDDVRDVMPERVAVSECERGIDDCLDASQLTTPKVS